MDSTRAHKRINTNEEIDHEMRTKRKVASFDEEDSDQKKGMVAAKKPNAMPSVAISVVSSRAKQASKEAAKGGMFDGLELNDNDSSAPSMVVPSRSVPAESFLII